MARLPSENYLIQQAGDSNIVVLSEAHTERELVVFDASDRGAVARAQKVIHDLSELSAEDKSFAHFWSGYFYAHISLACMEDDDEKDR